MGPRNSCVCVFGGGGVGGGKFDAALREKRGLSLVSYVTIEWWWVVRSYYVLSRGYFWFNIVIYFKINQNMKVWFQLVYSGTGPRTKTWHFSPQWFKGKIFYTCFFVDRYVQMIINWYENLHDTQTQHIHNIYYWNV
jgi:hypothetical protein